MYADPPQSVCRRPGGPVLLEDLILGTATMHADRPALIQGEQMLSYGELAAQLDWSRRTIGALLEKPGDRVAVYLPKTIEAVLAMFGSAAAGGVFIPVNPVLKAAQVRHILEDSGARILITASGRLAALSAALGSCTTLRQVLVTDPQHAAGGAALPVQSFAPPRPGASPPAEPGLVRRIDADLAAIFYTSGSTGRPKGVMLSHRNLVAGAGSVASYLENGVEDRILGVLPLSFDAGFSQLTTGFLTGASVILLDYLLAREVPMQVARHRVTGITGVPPLWSQLAGIDWPAEAGRALRYFASTGGVMPRSLLARLREMFPAAKPYLMYGLTEAFRSTWLPPEEVGRRPDSIGKAVPNAEVLVLREDGSPCAPGEPGELVHRGALVALGYWNAPEATAARFRPVPGLPGPGGRPEIAVWSGDTVVRDQDGFLYFRGRRDELIKTSGYRVSPEEIEESLLDSGLISEAVALGLPDPRLGQRIAVVVAGPADDAAALGEALLAYCREKLPLYMVPAEIHWRERLPRNANGKLDRAALRQALERDGSA